MRDVRSRWILFSVISFTIQANRHSSLEAFLTLMRTLIRVLISVLLFSALAVAQTATPAARPSQKAPEGTVGDCPGYPENCPPQGKKSKDVTTRAAAPQGWRAIHNSALVIDTHADTPGRFVDENFDISQDAGTGYLDFNKIKAGNLGAEFFSIWRSEERR